MFYARKSIFHDFLVHMEISVPRDNCFGRNSAKPCCPPVIPRDRNFDSHLKPIKYIYTYNQAETNLKHNVQYN